MRGDLDGGAARVPVLWTVNTYRERVAAHIGAHDDDFGHRYTNLLGASYYHVTLRQGAIRTFEDHFDVGEMTPDIESEQVVEVSNVMVKAQEVQTQILMHDQDEGYLSDEVTQ